MRSRYTSYYRNPKTHAERKANLDCEYARPGRRKLPSSWDDISVHHDKCWKGKRKKQHRDEPRGEEHTFELESDVSYSKLWRLEEYFRNHNIPYKIEKHRVTDCYTYEITERVFDKWIVNPYRFYVGGKKVVGPALISTYKLVKTGRFKTCKCSKIVGYTVHWWANKDIGVKYILDSVQLGR